jgi:hypothetical protein
MFISSDSDDDDDDDDDVSVDGSPILRVAL